MRLIRTSGVVFALLVLAAPASAQRFGVQADWSDDFDFGLGVRVEYDLIGLLTDEGPLSRTFLLGSFDYFFPDCGSGVDGFDCSYFELNANLAIPLAVSGIDPYVGAGLNFARFSTDYDGPLDEIFDFGASSSDIGLNLLGGLRFPLGSLSAFGEARFELGGGEQFVLTGGIMVGGSR